MTDNTTHRVAADDLRQRTEQIERLIAEKADAAELIKEAFDAAKGAGYDVKHLRTVIARRKRNSDDLAEETAIIEMYEDALNGSR
jgi:uncharacterized protein (UPF0335 family)